MNGSAGHACRHGDLDAIWVDADDCFPGVRATVPYDCLALREPLLDLAEFLARAHLDGEHPRTDGAAARTESLIPDLAQHEDLLTAECLDLQYGDKVVLCDDFQLEYILVKLEGHAQVAHVKQ